jgi:enamine deaminase RidA (YjgF/YER057c/UK114 family)
MSVQTMNPDGLVKPQQYTQVAIASGSRTVYLAGQVSQDADGNLVGAGDLAAQTEQALVNVSIALRAAGATFDNVAKTTIYVADWSPERLPSLTEGFARAAARLAIQSLRPTTLIGVTCLSHPGFLIEFDVTAVLP